MSGRDPGQESEHKTKVLGAPGRQQKNTYRTEFADPEELLQPPDPDFGSDDGTDVPTTPAGAVPATAAGEGPATAAGEGPATPATGPTPSTAFISPEELEPVVTSTGASATDAILPRAGGRRWLIPGVVLALLLGAGVGAGVAGLGLGQGPPRGPLELAPGAPIQHAGWTIALQASGAQPDSARPRLWLDLTLSQGQQRAPGSWLSLRAGDRTWPPLFWTPHGGGLRVVFARPATAAPLGLRFAPPGQQALELALGRAAFSSPAAR
jgi:hypothetical protein